VTPPAAVPRPPLVTCALIAVNVLVFLVGPISGLDPLYGSGGHRVCAEQRYYQRWGAVPDELLDNRASTARVADCPAPEAAAPAKVPALSVLTAMFVHGGWVHLMGNMLFLYVFGAMVEERMGRLAFLLFYLAAGYLATYGYAVAEMGRAGAHQVLVGASGAIAGVLGAYLALCPRARITTLLPFLFFLPLRFPAWLVLGFWFVLQWPTGHTTPGVAYPAHLIGFAAGFVYAWLRYVRGPRLRWPRPVQPSAVHAAGTPEEPVP
jgi:membrane associated rhomboid family serine protease